MFLFVFLQLIVSALSFTALSAVNFSRVVKQFDTTRLASSVEAEKATQCYIINAFDVEEEGAIPEIVCTPDPDDYAWFNGLERESMKLTDAECDDFMECVAGASPRGVPEWECRKLINEKPWQ